MTTTLFTEDSAAIVENDLHAFEWGPVLAGGVIAATTTFFLVVVGLGIGLSLAGTRNLSGVHSFLTIGAIWFLAAQAFGFALGGHITGRLMRPMPESEDEHFRADVHGLGVWSIAIIIGLGFAGLAGAVGMNQLGPVATQPMGYWADKLLTGAPQSDYASRNDQVARLLTADTVRENSTDHRQLLALVAGQNRISPEEAVSNVAAVEADIRTQADAARKALLYASLWTAFALLFGGFIAIAATVMARFHKEDFHPRTWLNARKA